MTDIATLTIEIRADGTAKVVSGLEQLEKQGHKTETSFSKLGGTAKKLALGFGALIGVTSVVSAFSMATKAAINFESAMTEVSTLTNSMDMGALTQSVKDLSAEFGSDKITQAKALYQVISAGASTAAEATGVLTVANKLAVGGVTDVATAADGLTSALNAYGMKAEDALDVSDMMFVAMRAGKTTIGELSQNIGKLAPLAAQAGVSMEELLAATAAVTKTGLDTSMTMNSLRQVIAGIIKPTSEATATAAELGIKFDAAALKSKGLVGMLQEIMVKTKGDTETLTQLFGSVEALGVIMALTSKSGAKDFSDILGQMELRAGETDAAFEKISKTTGFLSSVLKEQLSNVLLTIGGNILEYLNPALVYLTTNFDELLESAEMLGQLLLTGTLAKGLTALPGLISSVVKWIYTATKAMFAFDVAVSGSGVGLLITALAAAVAALIVFHNKTVEVGTHSAKVSSYVAATWEFATKSISKYFDDLGVDLKYVWNQLGGDTRNVLNTIIKYVAEAMPKIGKLFYDQTNWIIVGWVGLGKTIGIVLASLVTPGQKVSDAISEMWTEVSGHNYLGDIIYNVGYAVDEIGRMAEASENTADKLEFIVVTVKRIGPAFDAATESAAGFAKTTTSMAVSISDAEKEVTKTNTALAKAQAEIDKTTKEIEGPFAKALENTVTRIDEAFVQAWKGAYKSFDQFKEGLIDGFKELLAELAHIAITRPIIMSISAAFGLGSAAQAQAATTSAVNLFSGISTGIQTLFSAGGFSSMISGGLQNVAGAFESAGWDAGARYVTGYEDALANSGFGSVGMGALYTAGAGIVGGYVGGEVFGETTGVGAVAGTVAGTYIGNVILPGAGGIIGAAVGSFVGTGLERLAGNIFGFGGKGGNNAGRSTFDLATGSVSSVGIGKKFDQKNVDAAGQLAEQLKLFSDVIGGSNFQGSIKVGNTSGIHLDGKTFKTAEELFQYSFDKILDSATNLSQGLKGVIKSFEGTSQEIILFAAGMVTLTEMIKTNPVDAAITDIASAQEEASITMYAAYRTQVGAVADLILSYDGSAEATSNLAMAMDETRNRAYAMAVAITAIGESISAMLATSAASIREQLMSETEKKAFYREERGTALTNLKTATDPEDIARYAAEFEKWNTLLFNTLSETERQALITVGGREVTRGESFALAAEYVDKVASRQIDLAMKGVLETQEALNAGVKTMLDNAAKTNQGAADSMAAASTNFGAWVNRLITQGITVKVTPATSQVNV